MKKTTLVALVATTGLFFASCSNQDDPTQKHEQVTADIAVSLPAEAVGAMRMPGKTVQLQTSDFNGIENIVLVPFAKSAAVTKDMTRLGDNITLGDIANKEELKTGSNAKLYTEKQVPMGTSAFLFYGKSKDNGTTDFEKGKLDFDYSGNTAGTFYSSLSAIKPNATDVTGDSKYTKLLAYLNTVASATDGTKKWYEYETTDNEGLTELFNTFKTTTNLNSFAVQRMMSDLNKTLQLNTTDALAAAIRTAIATAEYADVDATSHEVTLKDDLQGFPANLNLPDGSVAVAWDAGSGAFIASTEKNYGTFNVAPTDLYTYPAHLWYYVNTKINTDVTLHASDYNDTDNWATISGKYSKKNSSVNSKTRSIALVDAVQYAVARLDVKIKAAETLEDNNPVAASNQIQNTTGYLLTGVLIGNQKNVGFDFTPETCPSAQQTKTYTIYDKVMTSDDIKATTSDYGNANSTLVLATEEGDDKDVNIAIELLNNSGKDFYGADGIVPNGGKFYLVGKLTSANSTVSIDGSTVKRVFIPDYTTTARLTIGNLKKAYNTIPDLKTPSLEIGLSVDLEWSTGTTYDVTL